MWKIIRNDRVRRRARSGLANTDAYSGRQQLPEVDRKAADRGHRAPDGNGGRYDVDAIIAIRPTGNRDAAKDIKNRERETRQQSELFIAQIKLCLDRFLQDDENLTINKIENVHDHQ